MDEEKLIRAMGSFPAGGGQVVSESAMRSSSSGGQVVSESAMRSSSSGGQV